MAFGDRGGSSAVVAFLVVAVPACSSSIAPVPAGGGPSDASLFIPDTGTVDLDAAPPAADASVSCAPANVHGYTPSWTPPKAPSSACTQADLTAYGACLDSGGGTSAGCAAWSAVDAGASAACRTCVADSKATDPAWGPLVDVGTSGSDRQLNVSGCLAIVLHDTGAGCAGTLQALQECEAAACADNCAGDSTAALSACTFAADGNGCSNYVAPSACVYEAGASAQTCFGPAGGTFGEKFAAIAAVFCLQTDAGP